MGAGLRALTLFGVAPIPVMQHAPWSLAQAGLATVAALALFSFFSTPPVALTAAIVMIGLLVLSSRVLNTAAARRGKGPLFHRLEA